MRRWAPWAMLPFVLAACEQAPPPESSVRHEPVVVYASYDDEDFLPELFEAFTAETGIPVTVRHRREEQNVAEVIDNSGSPPADVLITRAIHGIWQASDEGALRPLQIPGIDEQVPGWLRDPDDYWVATAFAPIGIAYDPAKVAAIADFDDLGNVDGGICLSAPWNAANRSLAAMLVAEHGARKAELMVRGWTANKALPAFDTERDVLEAINSGRCAVAIASATAVGSLGDAAPKFVVPEPAHVVAGGVGIGRHARYPDNARVLVAWLIGAEAQARHAEIPGLFAANADAVRGDVPEIGHREVGIAGAYDVDAIKLLERAGWR